MTSGIIAALVAVLVWGFVEAFGRFYPARETWWRIRRARGREAVRTMRERFETASERKIGRRLLTLLIALLIIWIASASLLDKRWYEVVADAAPSAIVAVAVLRVPTALRAIAERMKDYERDAGDDPDEPFGDDGGPAALAL
ncbi:MAG: hypothetical protein ACRDLB_07920 [Actinomycetota bacterium]